MKTLQVRVSEDLYSQLEEVRDATGLPTTSAATRHILQLGLGARRNSSPTEESLARSFAQELFADFQRRVLEALSKLAAEYRSPEPDTSQLVTRTQTLPTKSDDTW